MFWLAHTFVLATSTATVAPEVPPALPRQTLVFYNARLALRDQRPTEALKLWLLRNSLVDQGERGREDAEFRSVVWAALGSLGLCQDGFPRDDRGGAGLWPLALHNWVVQAARKGPPPDVEPPFEAFEMGRQQRFVSIHDVLALPELRSVTFFRSSSCLLHRVTLLANEQIPFIDLTDRVATGRLMRGLLVTSLRTLARHKVENVAAIEARIFDLDLALAQSLTRRARQEGLEARQRAKRLGTSEQGAKEIYEQRSAWPPDSKEAAFLRKSLTWGAEEWLTLSPTRRLFLFAQARPFAKDKAVLDRIALSVIDALVDGDSGADLEAWVGNLDAGDVPDRRLQLIAGDRGKRILELDKGTGFRERAVIALHRGVAFLEAGQLQDALRSFAYTMGHADLSRASAVTLALARRWLSFVLSRYETNDDVMATLKALVPRQEYNGVIEDLIWRAALRADGRSFDRVVQSVNRGGAIDATIASLRLLAQGNVTDLITQLRSKATAEPHSALRFAGQLLHKVEAEDADIRAAHAPTLKLLLAWLDSLNQDGKAQKAQARKADELAVRATAILEGLGHRDTSVVGKARALAPQSQTFAGNIRLAPADPLPWPFAVPQPQAPSAFAPFVLEPVEWRDAAGALVFGWRLTE
jgi:hypothetical protein